MQQHEQAADAQPGVRRTIATAVAFVCVLVTQHTLAQGDVTPTIGR